MPDRIKVILDTDIGNDIDDAVALAYLLAQPACELLGVTTVSAGTLDRARMASALCRVAGADVPIFPGIEPAILTPGKQGPPPQAVALDRWPHDDDFPRDAAVAFLSRTIRANPGEVVLLTIGPLTNLGVLFAGEPELPALLRALVMMCGVFAPAGREWNAINDPHATAIAYGPPGRRARPAVHRSIGLDVTRQVTMAADEVRRRFAGPKLLAPVLDFAEVWFADGRERITFHDPLAAASLFDDSLCGFERGRVTVELAEGEARGTTHFEPGADGPHEVALSVQPGRFFEHYFSVF